MTLTQARHFVTANPDAKYKGHRKHDLYLYAWEIIERDKRENAVELQNVQKPKVKVLDNPRFGRMVR